MSRHADHAAQIINAAGARGRASGPRHSKRPYRVIHG